MSKLKGVLFDMDGVLLDSEKYIAEAAIKMFREKGLEVKEEDFKPFVGAGEDRYLGGVAEKYNFPYDLDDIKKRAYEIYDDLVSGEIKPLAGVEEFIKKCRDKGLKLAVATSADKIKMLINLRETGLNDDTFDVLINGLDVEKKKPDPEIYLKAASELNLDPSDCLVVEDAINGVKAAREAGSRCLAVTTSFSKEELSDADWVTDSLEHIPDGVLDW